MENEQNSAETSRNYVKGIKNCVVRLAIHGYGSFLFPYLCIIMDAGGGVPSRFVWSIEKQNSLALRSYIHHFVHARDVDVDFY